MAFQIKIEAGVALTTTDNKCFALIVIAPTILLTHATLSMVSPLGYRTRNQGSTMQLSTTTQDSGTKIDTQHHSNFPSHPEQPISLTRDDYQYLISLLHASKQEHAPTVSSIPKPPTSDPNPHVVSSITQSGIPSSSHSLWILDSGAVQVIMCVHPYIFLLLIIELHLLL